MKVFFSFSLPESGLVRARNEISWFHVHTDCSRSEAERIGFGASCVHNNSIKLERAFTPDLVYV